MQSWRYSRSRGLNLEPVESLECCHTHCVVHLNLNPTNILFDLLWALKHLDDVWRDLDVMKCHYRTWMLCTIHGKKSFSFMARVGPYVQDTCWLVSKSSCILNTCTLHRCVDGIIHWHLPSRGCNQHSSTSLHFTVRYTMHNKIWYIVALYTLTWLCDICGVEGWLLILIWIRKRRHSLDVRNESFESLHVPSST